MKPTRRSAPTTGATKSDRPAGPVLSFDYGTGRTGVAVGQTLTGTASPLTTIDAHGRNPDWAAIDRLVAEWQPVALVIGIPLNMDGSDNEMTALASRFLRQLRARHRLPTYGVDERLTTFDAEQRLAEAGLPRNRWRGEIDRVAAQLILETWFAGDESA